jgi:hypothetical protein
MGEKMEISNNEAIMLIELYNKLDIGFIKKKDRVFRTLFCDYIGIDQNNSLTYKKVIQILLENNCVQIVDGEGKNKVLIIDSEKLDKLIRQTDYFNEVKDFIFKSTNGLAEVGV